MSMVANKLNLAIPGEMDVAWESYKLYLSYGSLEGAQL